MSERILYPSEHITTQQILDCLTGYSGSIAETFTKRAKELGYNTSEIQPTLDYLKDATDLLRSGLIPAEDHSTLKLQVEYWFGMARTAVQYANEIETGDNVIRRSLDALEGAMAAGGLLDDSSKEKFKELHDKNQSSSN